MAQVTAVLLNWKRPQNLPRLVSRLHEQSERPEVWVVNNAPELQAFGADRVAHIPWNAGVSIRVLMAVYVETPWVLFVDDDLMPGDAGWLADALVIAGRHDSVITGCWGRLLDLAPPHYRRDAMGHVDIIKGRVMLFRRDLLANVRLPAVPADLDVRFCEDIHLSLELGLCNPVHWADQGLQNRMVELEDNDALCHRADHAHERERFCEWYLEWRCV